MKTKKLLLPITFLLGIFLLSLISASVIIKSPTVVAKGTTMLNASGVNLINCTFYAKSPSTANNTWVNLGLFKNFSASAIKVNGTFVSTILEDGADYTFNATCRNKTNSIHGGVASGVRVDNTVPQTPSTLSPSAGSTDDDGAITFSGTVTARNTTACTLYFPHKNPGASSYAMTHTAGTCTLSLTIPEETYTYYVQASDGSNTTDSTRTTFDVSIDTPSNYLFQGSHQAQTTEGALAIISSAGILGINWTIIVIVLVALLVLYFVFKR